MRGILLLFLFVSVKISGCAQQKPDIKIASASTSGTALVTDSIKSAYIPKTLEFAGEKVPLDEVDVYERLDRELIVNQYKHSSTLLILKRAPRYKERVLKILKEEGVPEDFFYLAAIESDFDPYANSGFASGFWQFTPVTAEEYNLEVSDFVEQRYDIVASTYAACRMLKKAKERLGSWTMAAAAFNRGIKAIDTICKQQGVSSYYSLYINPETSRYVFRILALKMILENPQAYGYHVKEEEKYKPFLTKTVRVDHSIEDLVEFSQTQGISYKTLKFHNPWITYNPTTANKVYKKSYKFVVPPGKVYYFEIPVEPKANVGKN